MIAVSHDPSATACHDALPPRIRSYLNDRGISNQIIDFHLLGWNGERITIPVFDREGKLAFFKLAKDPEDSTDSPKMILPPGARAELYGWQRVLVKPCRIVICEGEFDRLALETRGFAAVTSTAGAATFRWEWAQAFEPIPDVYICFDLDEAGTEGARRTAHLIPQARIVELSEDVGPGGDVTDFFVRLGRSREDFQKLLEAAVPPPRVPQNSLAARPRAHGPRGGDIEEAKARLPIEELVARYLPLRRSGRTLMGRCPFHDDRRPSFAVYPETQHFHCYGCHEHGDVISFLMKREGLTFTEALDTLRNLPR